MYSQYIKRVINRRISSRKDYVLFAAFMVAASAAIVGFEETATCLLSTSHSITLGKTKKSGAVDLGMIMLSKFGIAIGAVMSLPFADAFGRLATLRYAAFAHFFISFWSFYIARIWAQMSARFMV